MLEKVLAEENTNMRIFGKKELRGHRRLGVLLARDESVEKALAKVERMAKSLKIEL
jgi:phosphoribosylglycinamide formyltransferase 2